MATTEIAPAGKTSIPLSDFPPSVAPLLAVFDSDGDGTIDHAELASAAQMYRDSLNKNKKLMRAVTVLAFVGLAVLAAMFGLVWAVVVLTQQTSVSSANVATFTAKSTGQIVNAGTTTNYLTVPLSSSMTVKQVLEQGWLHLSNGNDSMVAQIVGASKYPDENDQHVLFIYTTMGGVLVNGTRVSVYNFTTEPTLPEALGLGGSGATLPGQRRMQEEPYSSESGGASIHSSTSTGSAASSSSSSSTWGEGPCPTDEFGNVVRGCQQVTSTTTDSEGTKHVIRRHGQTHVNSHVTFGNKNVERVGADAKAIAAARINSVWGMYYGVQLALLQAWLNHVNGQLDMYNQQNDNGEDISFPLLKDGIGESLFTTFPSDKNLCPGPECGFTSFADFVANTYKSSTVVDSANGLPCMHSKDGWWTWETNNNVWNKPVAEPCYSCRNLVKNGKYCAVADNECPSGLNLDTIGQVEGGISASREDTSRWCTSSHSFAALIENKVAKEIPEVIATLVKELSSFCEGTRRLTSQCVEQS